MAIKKSKNISKTQKTYNSKKHSQKTKKRGGGDVTKYHVENYKYKKTGIAGKWQTVKRKLGITGALSGPTIRYVKHRKYDIYKEEKANKANFNQSQSLVQQQQYELDFATNKNRHGTSDPRRNRGEVKYNPLFSFTHTETPETNS